MEITKLVLFAFISLFLYMTIKEKKPEIGMLLLIAAGTMIFLAVIGQLGDVVNFIKNIAQRANIDSLYIGIVLKILAIAYLTSFCGEICKDAGAGTLASKIEFAGKTLILVLAIPILLAVLDSILQIL